MKLIRSYNFLTLKSFIYALNVSQDDLIRAEEIQQEFEEKLQTPVAIVCVKLEEEMMEMENQEKLEFIAEMCGIEASEVPTLDDLI